MDLWLWIFGISSIVKHLSKHLSQRMQQHGGCKTPLGKDKFV